MKNCLLSILAIILFAAFPATAQHTHDGITRCGTMQHLEKLMQQDPALETKMEIQEVALQNWIESHPDYFSAKDLLITIPVVVHVVWKTSSQNIPDEQIFSQIDVLNEDFRRLNEDAENTPDDFLDVAADVEVEFCLASIDPDGNPTDGIIRTETTVSSFTDNNYVKYSSTGGDDAWPMDDYLNIWVCNLGSGLLGYAQFPNTGSPATDGVVITYTSFGYNSPGGYPYHLGRTTTHEVGHWLNLRHIWGDDGGACWGSDLVGDTPNQGDYYWGCPSYKYSCDSDDMFMNFMDYTDDVCMNVFTEGQKTRVHAAINAYREELFDSPGCAAEDLPAAGFSANQTQIPVDCNVDFTDLSTGEPIAWNWSFEGGTPSTSTEQNPEGIVYSQAGSFMVSLEVENGSGSNTIEIEDFITVGDGFLSEVAFSASPESVCSSGSTILTDLSNACPIAWEWTFNPETVTFINSTNANSQNPELTFDEEGTYSVTLTATIANGDATLTKEEYIYAGGRPLPFVEDFEAENLNGWNIINPDGLTAWKIIEADGNDPGVQSMSFFFHEEASYGERDQLVSPVIDLTGGNIAALNFRYAYSQFKANQTDSLIIYASDDCGESWTHVIGFAEDGSGNFATVPAATTEFFPESAEDWCGSESNTDCITVDLSAWAGIPEFQFMFETYDGNGNKLILDDVEVTIATGIVNSSGKEVSIELYPVPAGDYIQADIKNIRGYVDVQILNIQGRVLFTERYVETNGLVHSEISLNEMSSGVYFVKLSNTDFSTTEKIVIK